MALPILIRDLAIILMSAGITSILFRWLRQPVVLGYVLAGYLVGPYSFFPVYVSDVDNIRVWGEIGVLFVLFSLGLDFSFRRLARVGGSAAITAAVETSFLLGLGILLGFALGWPKMDALFLGGALCISSTTIIAKSVEEMGLKTRQFVHLVMGVLVVEDLVAILLLATLSAFAVSKQVEGLHLLIAGLRLVFFLILWFVIGMFVLPRALRRLRRYLTIETTLVFSVGLCLMMVMIAAKAGFSPEMGAFVMGSLLAETDEGKRIETVMEPLRNLFGAIFFVSIGMLFNPATLVAHWAILLAMTAVLILGKTIGVASGALLSGQELRTSVKSALCMTQIGEFSFIIVGLGVSLHVIDARLFPLVIGASLISATLTPYFMRRSDVAFEAAEQRLPQRWLSKLERYREILNRDRGDHLGSLVTKAYGPLVVINVVMILAATWALRSLAYPQMSSWFGHSLSLRMAGLILDLFVCLPFFWGLILRKPSTKRRRELRSFRRFRVIEMAIALGRILLGAVLFLAVAGQFVSWRALSGFSFLVFGGLALVFYMFSGRIYRRLEKQFLNQFIKEVEPGPKERAHLLPWDSHVAEMAVAPEAPVCGMSLEQAGFNETFGVMIAAIERGRRRIVAPRADESIFPHDKLFVFGTDANLERLRRLVESPELEEVSTAHLKLDSIKLDASSPLCGRALRESGIRELTDGILVALERDGRKGLNPKPDLVLQDGDVLWVVGDPAKIRRLNRGKT